MVVSFLRVDLLVQASVGTDAGADAGSVAGAICWGSQKVAGVCYVAQRMLIFARQDFVLLRS